MRLILFLLFSILVRAAAALAAEPETVYGVAHVRKGAEEEFRALEKQSWDVYVRLGLVKPSPHILLQGVEDGDKPFFVVVFTWKDSEIPEHPPQEVGEVWTKMRAACEERSGHRPMEISEMNIVEPTQ